MSLEDFRAPFEYLGHFCFTLPTQTLSNLQGSTHALAEHYLRNGRRAGCVSVVPVPRVLTS